MWQCVDSYITLWPYELLDHRTDEVFQNHQVNQDLVGTMCARENNVPVYGLWLSILSWTFYNGHMKINIKIGG